MPPNNQGPAPTTDSSQGRLTLWHRQVISSARILRGSWSSPSRHSQLEHWTPIRNFARQGSTDPPVWPDDPGTAPRLNERQVFAEDYSVTFKGPEKLWTKTMSETDFRKYTPGQRWRLTIRLDQIAEIAPPESP